MRFGATTTSPRRWQPLAGVLMSASLVVGCGGDGTSPHTSLDITLPEGSRPPATAAPEEPGAAEPAPEPSQSAVTEPAPEPSEPAVTAPAPVELATADDEGLTSEEWTLLIVVGLAVLAVVIGAVSLASRRTRSRNQQRTTQQQRLDDITRGCRSIHDSAVLSILQTSNPVLLQSTFGAARNQLMDLEGRAAALATELSDESARRSLHDLGLAVAGVRGALETNVGLRVDPEGAVQGELIEASNRTVLHRSEQLESALQQVLYLAL